MAEVIEGCIRRHPDEWFCHKRRWKKGTGAADAERPAEMALEA